MPELGFASGIGALMNSDYIEAASGFVIIGDIVGFSKRVNDIQRELVFHLWSFLNSRPELTEASGNQAILNGTGDGALIAFPRNADESRRRGTVIHWAEVVSFARDWTEWMSRKIDLEGARPRLRIGIHQGPFQIVNVAKLGGLAQHGGFQIVGLAPNTCSRVAGLGDANDIAMSDEFIEAWKNASGVGSVDFDPALDVAATQVFVKHGIPIKMRRIQRSGPLPGKLESISIVNLTTRECLAAVEKLLLELINHEMKAVSNSTTGLTQEDLSARVSIWTPDPASGNLQCFPIRWHAKGRAVVPSITKYSITGTGTGPAGRAFCSQAPITIAALPSVNAGNPKTLKNYCQSLERLTGLPAATTSSFSCFSRSFITFPIGLRRDRPDAVICIDSDHPLDMITKAKLRDVALQLKHACNTALAAVLRLHLS